jgi:hypothetical protein
MNNKETYLYWLQANTKVNLREQEEEEGLIDKIQNVADYVSIGASFIPVVGQGAAAAIDSASSAVDIAQGQYGDAAFRGGMAALSAAPLVGGAGKLAYKAGRLTGKAVGAVKGGVDAVQAARAGTQGAQAVAKGTQAATSATQAARAGTQVATSAAKPSLAYRAGQATAKGAQMAKGAKGGIKGALIGAGISKAIGAMGDDDEKTTLGRERQPSFLDPAEAETRSNLVGQASNPTMSRRRDDQINPAFGYYGAQAMFRPIGYGMMEENKLNKMVNNHVQKFIKSRHGKKLKAEVNSIVKKVD